MSLTGEQGTGMRTYMSAHHTLGDLLRKSYVKNSEAAERLFTQCIKDKKTIAITGGMNSGKTTLLNASIGVWDINETVRVTDELSCESIREVNPAHNIIYDSAIFTDNNLDIFTQYLPSLLVVPELHRDAEIVMLFRILSNTPIKSMFTAHYMITDQLIKGLSDILMVGLNIPEEEATRKVTGAIDFDVHLSYNIDGERYIERITYIGTGKTGNAPYVLTDVLWYEPATKTYEICPEWNDWRE